MELKKFKYCLFVLILMGMFCFSSNHAWAYSYDYETCGDWNYMVYDDKAFIIEYTGDGQNITVPSDLDGYTVVSLGMTEALADEYGETYFSGTYVFTDSAVKSVVIPSTVKYIGDYTFYYAEGLENVTIPGSVTCIGEYAFNYCGKLTSVNLPDSIKTIGERAFEGCGKLTSLKLPSAISKISEYCFNECSSLTSVTIPVSVKEIERGAFCDCKALKKVYYAGSYVNWNKISIDNFEESNKYLINAEKVFSIKIAPKISAKKVTLYVNGTKTLKVSGPSSSVKWSSSNSKVASVSKDGTVKGLKKGTCTITASTAGYKLTCKVTVPGIKKVSRIKLSSSKLTMCKGQTRSLAYTVYPSTASIQKVKIVSGNSSVVKVSKGKLVAKKPGTATVTILAADGSGKKAVCKVTVVNAVKCSKCGGSGFCSICHGTGKHEKCNGTGKRYNVFYNRYDKCSGCNGTGKCACGRVYNNSGKCISCYGKGYK